MKHAFTILVGCLILLAGSLHDARAQHGRTVAILMPGAGGAVPDDFLMRNRGKFSRAGIRTIVTTSPSEAVAISRAEHSKGNRVVIVGMSRGAINTATALASGATVSRAVFVSGNFRQVAGILKSSTHLPSTLVVQHRHDLCPHTPPKGAIRFIGWAKGKARIHWIDTNGAARGGPCGPFGAHGFFGNDGPAIAAIISFIR
jgi:hypothetical protein